MNNEIPKWRLVGGKIYQLVDIFDNCLLAMKHAKTLKKDKHVILTKLGKGKWAVYWRARESTAECPPELYKIC
ncbi:MAG: hypothetical protein PVG65_01910 [Candidatus Thorarchaeota archaeon]|jgi:hypothetical protein